MPADEAADEEAAAVEAGFVPELELPADEDDADEDAAVELVGTEAGFALDCAVDWELFPAEDDVSAAVCAAGAEVSALPVPVSGIVIVCGAVPFCE